MLKIWLILFTLFCVNGYAQEDDYGEDLEEETVTQESAQLPPNLKIDPDKMVGTILESYRKAPEAEVAKHLEERIRILPIGNMIEENSKFFTFLARVMRDEKALPGFFGILKNRNRLLIFAVVNVMIFLAGYMWKRNHKKNTDIGALAKIKRSIIRILVIQSFHLIFFIVYFKTEITPFWEITKRTYL
jgi:hypothetical protein